MQPAIRHIRIWPQHQWEGRGQYLSMRAFLGERHNHHSAGVRHRQCPRRQLDGPGTGVDETMRERDLVGAGRHADLDFLLDTVVDFRTRCEAHAVVVELVPLHRRIVQRIGARFFFRGMPEAMPAADHPFGFPGAAHLVRKLLHHIGAANESEAYNARPDIQRGHQLDGIIRQFHGVLPAAVGDLGNHINTPFPRKSPGCQIRL